MGKILGGCFPKMNIFIVVADSKISTCLSWIKEKKKGQILEVTYYKISFI